MGLSDSTQHGNDGVRCWTPITIPESVSWSGPVGRQLAQNRLFNLSQVIGSVFFHGTSRASGTSSQPTVFTGKLHSPTRMLNM